MLPLPYGLLAHELIEVLDQERYLPGITWVGKFAEEFPFLDHHSMKKEKDQSSRFYNPFKVFKIKQSSSALTTTYDTPS